MDNAVGWALMAVAVCMTVVFGLFQPEAAKVDVIGLFLSSVVYFVMPLYVAYIIYLSVRRSYHFSKHFFTGAVIFFLTFVVYLIVHNDPSKHSLLPFVRFSAIGLWVISFWLMRPAIEFHMKYSEKEADEN